MHAIGLKILANVEPGILQHLQLTLELLTTATGLVGCMIQSICDRVESLGANQPTCVVWSDHTRRATQPTDGAEVVLFNNYLYFSSVTVLLCRDAG